MHSPESLAAAVSPETAAIVPDYPYGFTLRCSMRVWVEYKPGKGFRYCTQTTNPKKAYTLWNAPKRSTYARVAMCIRQGEDGHLNPASVSEYADATELAAYLADNAATLSDKARDSVVYHYEVRAARDAAIKAQGVTNVFDATPEQRDAIRAAWLPVVAAHVKAGTAY